MFTDKYIKSLLFFLALTAFLICSADCLYAKVFVQVDRKPLTSDDSGLYCNYSFEHGVKSARDGITNLLPAERAASKQSPWTFYIMQYKSSETPAPNHKASYIEKMAKNGKKIILRAWIGKNADKEIDVNKSKRILTNTLAEVNPEWLYALTLDEENVYWTKKSRDGNTKALIELYHWAKKNWPDLPIYQWWSPMIAPDVNATRGWVALPADGWVCDLYGEPKEVFEEKLKKFLATGKQLVHIAWSSPTWVFYKKEGFEKEDKTGKWWLQAGREVFDDQLDVCKRYNVPVAHFCTQPNRRDEDGNIVYPIRWGWHAVDPLVRRWYVYIESNTPDYSEKFVHTNSQIEKLNGQFIKPETQ